VLPGTGGFSLSHRVATWTSTVKQAPLREAVRVADFSWIDVEIIGNARQAEESHSQASYLY
jgi:hypothetical protein